VACCYGYWLSMCTFSQLFFHCTVKKKPDAWAQCELEALQRLLPGPQHWFQVDALRSLQLLGFPKSIPDLHALSVAIRFRVASRENSRYGGLCACHRNYHLKATTRRCDFLARLAKWSNWIESSALASLSEAVQTCGVKGVTAAGIESDIAEGAARPWTAEVHRRVQRQFQRQTVTSISEGARPQLEKTMRNKLDRWKIAVLPRCRVDRAIAALPCVAKKIPPRALAAVIRTLWNGWCTGRRFQNKEHQCMFGCRFGQDSIEHYGTCTKVWDFFAAHFPPEHTPRPDDRLTAFLLLNTASAQAAAHVEKLRSYALLVAATYLTHNTWRHKLGIGHTAVIEAMAQHLLELRAG